MASPPVPSLGQLVELLKELEFVEEQRRDGLRVCRHVASDTWLAFADRSEGSPARQAEVVSVRKQLTERGLLTEDDFERFLARVTTPHNAG